MKQEDTKQKILDKALELFSSRGYDAVSVGEIAQAVGIKAPSLYNHLPSKQAIFDATPIKSPSTSRTHRRISPFSLRSPKTRFSTRSGRFSSIRSITRPSAASAA